MTETTLETETETAESSIFMIGIGASAGGLEAIRALLHNAPQDLPAAYAVAQHMSPTHRSMLTELIDRETHLRVVELSNPVTPHENTVYVTPPNHDVILQKGKLRLKKSDAGPAVPKPSVDRLFISIAEELGDRSVGIVLSGTGSDGSYGIKAIREAGGITIAQDDRTATYDGMPLSAVETGCVDMVLPPIEIGPRLASLAPVGANRASLLASKSEQPPISEILQILLARTRVDFRDYKPTTVQRRLERRMHALDVKTEEAYAAYCRTHPEEVDALFRDLLISVTRFFRDPEEYAALKPHIQRLADDTADRALRVWVAGCATGEEVYSIAMLLAEACGGLDDLLPQRLKFFASDIDENALEKARRGVYPRAALNDIPPDLAEKYLTITDDTVEVVPELRAMVLFSVHNVAQDPPFLHIDLICCRNVLIYFGPILHDRTLSNLHYGLNDDGMLFIGTADNASGASDLFSSVKGSGNVLRRRSSGRIDYRARGRHVAYRARRQSRPDAPETLRPDSQVNPLVKAIARSFSQNGVLMTRDLQIVAVFGELTGLITLNENSSPTLNHTVLVEPLGHEVLVLTTMAGRTEEAQTGRPRSIENRDNPIQVSCYPLKHDDLPEDLFFIAINEVNAPDPKPVPSESLDQVDTLRDELDSTRNAMNLAVEEWETANEELRSANEELQSNNEELQSMNEELETSNEELQSTNEELVSVNEVLQVTTNELTELTEEQDAILEQLANPLLIIDHALQVTKFSRSAGEIFRMPPNASRPHVSQLAVPEGFPALAEICDETLRLGAAKSVDFQSEGIQYRMNCAPYANARGQLRGATITFTPI